MYRHYRRTYFTIALAMAFAIPGCKEIFETDLKSETVHLNVPANSAVVPQGNVQFWWDEVDGAEEYRLQIVENTFSNPRKLILDTLIDIETHYQFLSSGSYSWRVQAENSTSQSKAATRFFTVDSTTDLTGQNVLLKDPNEGLCINDSTIRFSWYPMPGLVQYYRFEIREGDFVSNTQPIFSQDLYGDTSIVIDFTEPGQYSWGLKPVNDFSSGQFSTRTIVLDFHDPAPPSLVFPLQTDTVDRDSLYFEWQRQTDESCGMYDSLFVHKNDLNGEIVIGTGGDFTLYDAATLLATGNYAWRVVTYDGAGNKSFSSDVRLVRVE